MKIALIGALAVTVALGILVAFLGVRSPLASSSADAETNPMAPRASTTTSATASPSVSATPTVAPVAPPVVVQPAPPAPVTLVVPAPVLPAPPAPVIPVTIDLMGATVLTGECTTTSTIIMKWASTGASENSAEINVRSGGGLPIVNQSWSNLPATGTQYIHLIDCTRPLWFFKVTVSNGTQTKSGLLTFANGKATGWSSVVH